MILDFESADGWCQEVLGAGAAAPILTGGHLAAVMGVELNDGRRVVLKVRPSSPRLTAVIAAQRHLYDAGIPCPRPLTDALPFQGQTITAETYMPADPPPAATPPADACADLLADVVTASPPASAVSELGLAPPWVGWDHPGDGLWPPPDDLDVDLNGVADDDWIDDAAQRVQQVLRTYSSEPVVGHVDWEAHNIGWHGRRPVVIYDWDSLAIRSEPTIAGAAATVFASTTGTTIAASVSETSLFLDRYQRRRRPFRADDLRAAWAAGLWTLLYNAKKETAGAGRGYLQHLEAEFEERIRLATL